MSKRQKVKIGKQKTLQLPIVIIEAIQNHEDRTGVRFNRIVTAAALKYLLTHKDGDPWMERAVALSKGQTDLATIRAECAKPGALDP